MTCFALPSYLNKDLFLTKKIFTSHHFFLLLNILNCVFSFTNKVQSYHIDFIHFWSNSLFFQVIIKILIIIYYVIYYKLLVQLKLYPRQTTYVSKSLPNNLFPFHPENT